MPKGPNYEGFLIKGSRCPQCNEPLVYNGNYWCSECDYVMPELTGKSRRADKHAFNVAYTLFMQQRGKEPEANVLYRDAL